VAAKARCSKQMHRESDGGVVLGKNTDNGEKRHIALRSVPITTVTDDMGVVSPRFSRRFVRARRIDVTTPSIS